MNNNNPKMPAAPKTANRQQTSATPRPLTSKHSASFSRAGRLSTAKSRNNISNDPLQQGIQIIIISANETVQLTPEEKKKNLEKKIQEALEESQFAAFKNDSKLALEKAKEAVKRERMLTKEFAANSEDIVNPDLTYCVLFNLATQLKNNQLYQESLNTYTVIVKNKLFTNASRLRVNMGSIYSEMKDYAQAIKQYQMALDQIPPTNNKLKSKIFQNIGLSFIQLAKYRDAIISFQSCLESYPTHLSAYNLLVCFYVLSDIEKLKEAFYSLVHIPNPFHKELLDDQQESLPDDELTLFQKQKQDEITKFITLGAKLVAPLVAEKFEEGFEWVLQIVKESEYPELVVQLEGVKALDFLKAKKFDSAIETLKSFEKRDPKMLGYAMTNLSFIYLNNGMVDASQECAQKAIEEDKYNAKALNNLGNSYFITNNYEKAKKLYLEAISLDVTSTEAIYNVALTELALYRPTSALTHFEKLQNIFPNDPEVMVQIALIHETLQDYNAAIDYLKRVIPLVPTDPEVLLFMSRLYDIIGDHYQANHYSSEANRYQTNENEPSFAYKNEMSKSHDSRNNSSSVIDFGVLKESSVNLLPD